MHGLLAASSPLEERRVGVPARSRVDHRSATDGRLATEDDTVAAGCDDGRCEPELRKALPRPHDPGRYCRGAVVNVEARSIRDRHELLERDIEPVARRECSGRQQRVAPLHLVPLDARKRDRHSLARLGPLDRTVVHLDAAHANVASARLGTEHVTDADRSRPESPRRDRPDPAQREHAVDVEAGFVVHFVFLKHKVCAARERGRELGEPGAGLRAHYDHLGSRDELPRLLHGELERFGVDRIRLRDRDDAVLDPEQREDREMLVGLRPRPLGGVDDEKEEVDPRSPGDHVPHEALVSRDVDQRQAAAVRKVERRVAEIDRDPARALLRQSIGVLPGQSPDEPRLAVVDVAGRADRQRHAWTAATTSSASASVRVRQSSSV